MRYTYETRLRTVRELAAATHRERLEYLAREGISWATYCTWRRRYRQGGAEALRDRRLGRPGLPSLRGRVDDLDRRVTALEEEE